MPSLRLIRTSIALVWMYEGLWCKVLGHAPRHEAILTSLPLLTTAEAHSLLLALGCLECVMGVWVISGWRPAQGALIQTALLVSMNAGGLIFASRLVPDPAGMLLQNFTFLLLAWTAAANRHTYEPHS
jgi:DoxX-like family